MLAFVFHWPQHLQLSWLYGPPWEHQVRKQSLSTEVQTRFETLHQLSIDAAWQTTKQSVSQQFRVALLTAASRVAKTVLQFQCIGVMNALMKRVASS